MKKSKEIMWYAEAHQKVQKVYFTCIIAIIILFLVALLILPRDQVKSVAINEVESLQMLLSITGLGLCFIAMILNQALLKATRVKMACQQKREQQHLMLSFIITWVLALSCAFCGFGLAWILNESSQFSLFGVIALLTILAHPFTKGRVKRALSFD